MSVPRVALDVDEAAESCAVKRDTVMRAIRSGRLRARRSGEGGGGKYLVRVVDLEAWIESMPSA